MIKEPTRYEQRIGDYMETLQLTLPERKAVWGRLGCHKLLLGRTIKDIFICNGASAEEQNALQTLWVFTSDAASEIRGADSQLDMDFISHRDIRYVNLGARESDLFSVGPKSSVTVNLRYAGGHTASLAARGSNCLQLMTMFRKYFSRRMSP
jgi:hypothetical protein